jgi:peptidoglycan/LPS O-acetylase OafA/YrhL
MRAATDRQVFFTPLESLRGLAALTVVLFHARWVNPVTTALFFQNGGLMVDLFFVLSGFVMSHTYGARLNRLADCRQFMWLRLGRLYPLHLVMLLVFVGLEVVKYVLVRHFGDLAGPRAFTVNGGKTFVANVLLLQSLGVLHVLAYNWPSWSISAEFYTYALFALVAVLATPRRFTVAATGVVLASLATLLALGVPLGKVTCQWGVVRCAAGFFMGTLTYRLYARLAARPLSGIPWAWVSAVTFTVAILFLSLFDMHGRRALAILPLGSLMILSVVMAPASPLSRFLSLRPLVWLGTVSYSIYMVHAAVLWPLQEALFVAGKYPRVEFMGRQFAATPRSFGLLLLFGYVGLTLLICHFTFGAIEVRYRRKAKERAARWWGGEARGIPVAATEPVAPPLMRDSRSG